MTALDEGVLYEKLLRLKNSRSGYLSNVTVKLNEIDALLSNEENIDRVKEKLTEFHAAFESFKEAHILYLSFVQDEACIARCQESFDREVVRRDDFIQRVHDWIVRTEEALRLNSQVSPNDSVSCSGFRSASKSSRRPKRSSYGGSHSTSSSLSAARAKEAARIAELKAEAATFKKRQSLEQQRFRLRQEEKLLTLETEIAKSQAREQALALVDPSPRVAVSEPAGSESNPRLITPNPATLEIGRPVAKGHSTLNPEVPE